MAQLGGNDRFVDRKELGRGGMGVVYSAFDRDTGTRVALKALRNTDAQTIHRFKREFRALQDLEHPNLVRLGELFEQEGDWFFTMELVDGVDILSFVWSSQREEPDLTPSQDTMRAQLLTHDAQREAPFDEARLRHTFGQLATAIYTVHESGKIHRDIKPSNVLVDRSGRTVLLDFGLVSNRSPDQQSNSGHVVGTVEYMAPEQAALGDASLTPSADWYSFGALLYEALTARLPHHGNTAVQLLLRKQQHIPPPPRSAVGSVPPDLDALCVDLLQVDPDSRPDGLEILDRLGVTVERTRLGAGPTSSIYSQAPEFVGRADESAVLDAAFDELRHATSAQRLVLVKGESGIGKSALVQTWLERVANRDPEAVLLSCRCYERESVPYKALDGVMDELATYLRAQRGEFVKSLLPNDIALLGHVFPVLRRVDAIARCRAGEKSSPDPQVLRTRAFEAVRGLLARLGEQRPLVIYIDDFHWSDPDGRAMLSELFEPPSSPRLLLVVTALEAELPRLASWLDGVPLPQTEIELGPLSAEDVARLVGSLGSRVSTDDEQTFQLILKESGGHPLFVQELAHNFDEVRRDIGLDDVVWQRIRELSAELRRLLGVIAVAGAPLAHETVAATVEESFDGYYRQVGLLRVAYLVRTSGVRPRDRVECYHDRVRAAVMSHLSEAERRELLEQLLLGLERAGAAEREPEQLIALLVELGETKRARRLAEEAAGRAEHALAFARAADLYDVALDLTGAGDNTRRELLLRRANALVHAGRGVEAAEALLAAGEGADRTTWLECQRRAGEQLLLAGHLDEGLAALDQLLSMVRVRLPKTVRGAMLSVAMHRLFLRMRGLRWTERQEGDIPAKELARLDVYLAVTAGLTTADTLRGVVLQGRTLRLALELGEPRRLARALAVESGHRSMTGPRGRRQARKLIGMTREIAERLDDPYLHGWVSGMEGFRVYFTGNFGAALPLFTRAEEWFRDHTTGTQWELGSVRVFRLFCLVRQGLYKELARAASPYVRDAHLRGDRYVESSIRRSTCRIWLASDRPDLVGQELSTSRWSAPTTFFHLQHWYELEARAELALYEGLRRDAFDEFEQQLRDLDRSLLTNVQIVRAIARWLEARLLLAAADTGEPPVDWAARAAKIARRLERDRPDFSYVDTPASLIRAALSAAQGNQSAAIAHLESASESRNFLCRAAALHRMGELIGGDAGRRLQSKASAWASSEGIVRPERLFRVVAPFPKITDAPR